MEIGDETDDADGYVQSPYDEPDHSERRYFLGETVS
jgi:hypothetical protein